ncbi:hypothetical protein AMECASPLE_029289 [Ameca splendens]|uniref:Uncharacterized protein n=1 Tax=Ameca splendens TaxID=208324 RepID=A0ABV0YSR4_9TELE
MTLSDGLNCALVKNGVHKKISEVLVATVSRHLQPTLSLCLTHAEDLQVFSTNAACLAHKEANKKKQVDGPSSGGTVKV